MCGFKKGFNGMPELKLCPCCSSEAEIKHVKEWDSNVSYKAAYVQCQDRNCGIRTPSVCVDGYFGSKTTEEDVIKIWNKRTNAKRDYLMK